MMQIIVDLVLVLYCFVSIHIFNILFCNVPEGKWMMMINLHKNDFDEK